MLIFCERISVTFQLHCSFQNITRYIIFMSINLTAILLTVGIFCLLEKYPWGAIYTNKLTIKVLTEYKHKQTAWTRTVSICIYDYGCTLNMKIGVNNIVCSSFYFILSENNSILFSTAFRWASPSVNPTSLKFCIQPITCSRIKLIGI